jgi:hypothetical protein
MKLKMKFSRPAMNAPLCLIDFIMCLIERLFKNNMMPMQAAFRRYTRVVGLPETSPKVLIMKLSFSVDAILSIVG